MDRNDDGSITVRFTAGGEHELCWHLITWGTTVTVEQPESLRRFPCTHPRIGSCYTRPVQ